MPNLPNGMQLVIVLHSHAGWHEPRSLRAARAMVTLRCKKGPFGKWQIDGEPEEHEEEPRGGQKAVRNKHLRARFDESEAALKQGRSRLSYCSEILEISSGPGR